MKVGEFKFDELLSFDPHYGQLLFRGEDLGKMSAESFGDLLNEMIEIGGPNMARVLMGQIGRTAGRNDARTIRETLPGRTDLDWLAFGPAIRTWEGIVEGVAEAIEIDRMSGRFYIKGIWKNSFFAEQYVRLFGRSKNPVCWFLNGYATGYASEFFGARLVAHELSCKGKGDDACRFEIAPVQ
jgi:predicted hydrocarbon binding protein